MSLVSIEKTARRYVGDFAAGYEAKRTKQRRWHLENEAVEHMLFGVPAGSGVLDAPCGAGRFFSLYRSKGLSVMGVDVSADMLALARRKLKRPWSCTLLQEGILEYCADIEDKEFDVAVCVRFLDLIDEDAMRQVVKALCRVTRDRIILTIRFGSKYVPKVNTAEHDAVKFKRLIAGCGWHITYAVPIFKAGWTVLQLERKEV